MAKQHRSQKNKRLSLKSWFDSNLGFEPKQVPDLIDLRRPLKGDFLGFEFGYFAHCEKITNFLSSGELRSRLRTSGEITVLIVKRLLTFGEISNSL